MKLSEKIELYIDGELDGEEKTNIERQINENPELEREFHIRKELNELLKEALLYPRQDVFPKEPLEELDHIQKLEIEEDFRRFHEQYPSAETRTGEEKLRRIINKSGRNLKRSAFSLSFLLTVAASISLVAVMSSAFIYLTRMIISQNQFSVVYRENFQPQQDPLLQTFLYESGFASFREAQSYFPPAESMNISQILRSSVFDDHDLLYIALVSMQEKKFKEAGLILEYLCGSENTATADAASWYYSLLLLKEGKKKIAQDIIQELCAKNSYYKSHSCSLLKSLSAE